MASDKNKAPEKKPKKDGGAAQKPVAKDKPKAKAKPKAEAAPAAEEPKAKPAPVPRPPADPRLKVLKKLTGRYLPRGPLRDRKEALMTRWNSGDDHGGDIRLGIGGADIVKLSTRRGAAAFRAKVTDDIRADTVFVPFHWVGANRLTNDALDPASRMPEFKVCAAAVSA